MSEIAIVPLDDGRWTAKKNGIVIFVGHSQDEVAEWLSKVHPEQSSQMPWQITPGPYWRH
jgi:polysaccharide deacetylase 2 family uncharacterized protein YibQ